MTHEDENKAVRAIGILGLIAKMTKIPKENCYLAFDNDKEEPCGISLAEFDRIQRLGKDELATVYGKKFDFEGFKTKWHDYHHNNDTTISNPE